MKIIVGLIVMIIIVIMAIISISEAEQATTKGSKKSGNLRCAWTCSSFKTNLNSYWYLL